MLTLLLWLAVLLTGVVVLFLSLPLRLRLSLRSDPALRSFLVVRPFGGVFFPVRIFDTARPPDKTAPSKPKRQKTWGTSRRGNSAALRRIPGTLRRMIGAVTVEEVSIDAEFGLGDPAETGQLYGQLSPLVYAGPGQIRLRPNFEQLCLRGSADAQVRLIPLAVLWPLGTLLWHLFGPAR